MPGSRNLFDGQDLTGLSESKPRTRAINTLQVHHATTTSFAGLKALMAPGGRVVSANGAMSNTGHLDEVVLLARRAFTSATPFDNQCLTVEVANTSLGPTWGISEVCRVRLAKLAVDMFHLGILGGVDRHFIIGHNEVPGTYATSCPGPDMHLDHIVDLAQQLLAGKDFLMALSDADQADLYSKTLAIYDALFSEVPVERPGRTPTIGGVLVNQSIEQDALFQVAGKNGAARDGLFEWMRKVSDKLGIASPEA